MNMRLIPTYASYAIMGLLAMDDAAPRQLERVSSGPEWGMPGGASSAVTGFGAARRPANA